MGRIGARVGVSWSPLTLTSSLQLSAQTSYFHAPSYLFSLHVAWHKEARRDPPDEVMLPLKSLQCTSFGNQV